MSTVRALSLPQASNCEHAKEPVCHCRCGGTLHGARRGGLTESGAPLLDFFERLPKDDPHHLPDASERRVRVEQRLATQRAEREAATKRRYDMLARVSGGIG